MLPKTKRTQSFPAVHHFVVKRYLVWVWHIPRSWSEAEWLFPGYTFSRTGVRPWTYVWGGLSLCDTPGWSPSTRGEVKPLPSRLPLLRPEHGCSGRGRGPDGPGCSPWHGCVTSILARLRHAWLCHHLSCAYSMQSPVVSVAGNTGTWNMVPAITQWDHWAQAQPVTTEHHPGKHSLCRASSRRPRPSSPCPRRPLRNVNWHTTRQSSGMTNLQENMTSGEACLIPVSFPGPVTSTLSGWNLSGQPPQPPKGGQNTSS